MRQLDPTAAERDYAKSPLTRREVEQIARAAADLALLVNTRHALARSRMWHERPPSRSAFVDAVLETPNLLRRPVLLRRGRAILARDEAQIRSFLRSA